MVNTMPKVVKASTTHRRNMSTSDEANSPSRISIWSKEEDDLLKTCRAQGLNWNQIAPLHFPRKSPNACRKRHERLMEKQKTMDWGGGEQLDRMALAYDECREEMWSILAERLGDRWETMETKCMEKGFKTLLQTARSARKKGVCLEPRRSRDRGLLHDPTDVKGGPSAVVPTVVTAFSPFAPGYALEQPMQHPVTHAVQHTVPQPNRASIQSILHSSTPPMPHHHTYRHQ